MKSVSKIPRPTKGSYKEVVDNNQVHETSEEESTSSDQEVFLNPQASVSAQEMPNMYMPYIEGLQMDWKSMMGYIADF